ncbi:MAG: GGDEF domain-containing protein [Mobilitalea sp.]
MEQHKLKIQFETEQYRNQANLVYLGTLLFSSLLSLFFYFVVKSPILATLNLGAVLISALAIYLNRIQRYGLGSLLYIIYVNIVTFAEVYLLGFASGFHYIFFSQACLIMYTNWKPKSKAFAVLLQILLFALLILITEDHTPHLIISYNLTLILHIFNITTNIIAVANSANYYIGITTRAHKKISTLAMRDYLTHLMNRTAFDDYIADLFKARTQEKEGLGLLFLDIDHFKRINDTCGHLCGDEILRQFATILQKNIGATDYAARYGGEEFVLVTKVENPDQLQYIAEQIRQEVDNMNFVFEDQTKHVSVSIGALLVPAGIKTDHHKALQYVDKLLYKAKAEGRNRVVFEKMGRNNEVK